MRTFSTSTTATRASTTSAGGLLQSRDVMDGPSCWTPARPGCPQATAEPRCQEDLLQDGSCCTLEPPR